MKVSYIPDFGYNELLDFSEENILEELSPRLSQQRRNQKASKFWMLINPYRKSLDDALLRDLNALCT